MFSSMSVASAPTSSLQQREVEGEELDAPWLDLRKPSIDTHARLHEPINLEGLPSECNLFDVSSKKGVFVAAGIDAFSIYSLEALETLFTTAPRSTTSPLLPIKTVSLGERLVWIKFAKEDSVVITSTSSSTIRIFSVEALKSEQAPQPLQSFPSLPSAIISLQPNPEALPSLVLILQAASLSLLDVDSQTETMRLEGRYTAATWSPKGKQVVVGDEQGRLRFFGPDGSEKGVALARPSGLEGDYFVNSIHWLENDVFLVTYNLPIPSGSSDPEHSYELYILARSKVPSPSVTCTHFLDPSPAFGLTSRAGVRYGAFLSSWGGKGNWLGFLGNAPSPLLGVISASAQDGGWKVLTLDETSVPSLPLSESSSEDSCVLGMGFDLRTSLPIKRGMVGGEELEDLPAAPRLLVYTSDGVLAGWNIVNSRQGLGSYDGMIKESSGGEISMAGTPARVASPPPSSAPPASAFAGFGSSPSSSAFGSAIKPPSSAFGAPTFGQPSSTGSAFGQTSAFGGAIKPPTTSSAFGAPSAFGQTSSFGAPAPSSSAFGTPTKPPASSSGFGAFSTTPSTTPAAKPAFGGFGSNAFGAPSTFGSTSTFGAAATPKTPAEEKKASPFSGGFGAFSTTPSPSPAPASTPVAAPASPSPVPAFGKPAPTAFGAFGSSSSAFGATSTFGSSSSSAFGSLPSSAPAAAPSTAFGNVYKPSSAFGNTSTFGAPSTFGSAKPVFGASTIAGPKIAPVVASTGAFGAFAPPSTSTGAVSPFGSASASPFGAALKGGEGFGGLLASPGGSPSTESPKSAFGGFGKPAQTSAFGSAPLSSAFTGFGAGASSSSSSPFAGVPLPKITDASMPSTPLVSPSVEQPPKPSAFSFGARITETLDDDEEEDGKKGKGSAFADDLGDELEPSEEAKKSGSSSDLFGGGGGTSFGFGGLGGGGGKSASGGPGGMFGSVAHSNSISVQFNENEEEEEEPVADEQEDEEEEYDEEAEGSYSEGGGEEGDQGEEEEVGSGEEEEVEGVSENPSTASLPTIIADGVKIEELPEESPTEVPLPPSTTPSPAPPSPQPPISPSPEPTVEPASTSPQISPPSPSTSLPAAAPLQQPALDRSTAPSPEPEPKAVEPKVPEAPKPSPFGLFGQPKPTEAPSPPPPSTVAPPPAPTSSPPPLFGDKTSSTPPAAPSEPPKTTPSPTPPSKPPMFGSKPMFGGKGFPSTAPIRSSPLASPPITRPDDLDKSTASSVASPPLSPEPTNPTPQPFSFGSKPTQPPAEQSNPFGGSSTPLAKPKSGGLGLGLPSSQPSKPSAPPSFGFGAPPPEAPKVASALAATPSFGGWGAPPPAPPPSKAAPGPSMTFGGFGQPKPVASTPTPSFFGAPPLPPASEPPKPPSPSFFGAPSTPNKASQPQANLFGSTTPQSKPPTFSSPAMLPPAPQKLASPPPTQSFQAPATPKGFPPTLSGSTTPKIEAPAPVKPAFPQRTSTGPKSSNAPEVKETGLAGEFLKAYLLLNQEISDLQTAARSYSQFQREAGKPSSQVGDLDTQPAWTLGDLPRLKTLAKAKEEETLSLTDESFAMKRKIAELQSLMLKADTKMEESARFLRAKDDPDFAKMIRVRQLGPEHTENQQKLRKTTQLVRDRVLQLENHLAVLKKRVGQEKSGSVPMKAPSLDTIARTMRNITVAVNEKTYEIDDLELRLDVLRLTSKKTSSTPSRNQRASTPLSEASNTTSPLRSALNRPAVNPKVASIAARALNDERKSFQVKASILAARKEPIFNQSMAAKEAPSSSSRSGGGDVLLSRGPVKFEALPSPRRAPPPQAASSSKAPGPSNPFGSAPTPLSAGPTPSSSLGWGSSSISLSAFATPTPNPNNPSSLFSSTQPTFSGLPPDEFVPLSSGREMDSRRRTKGFQHISAPKARSPASSPNPPVASSSGFSFGPPPALSTARAPGSGLMTFEGLQPPTSIKKSSSSNFFSSAIAPPPPAPANEEDEYEEDGDGEEEYDEEEFDEEEEWEGEEGEEDYSYEGEGEEGDETR